MPLCSMTSRVEMGCRGGAEVEESSVYEMDVSLFYNQGNIIIALPVPVDVGASLEQNLSAVG